MRLHLTITLDLSRKAEDETPERESTLDAMVERAEPAPLGFAVLPPRTDP